MSYKNKDWLYDKYWNKEMSTMEIGNLIEVSYKTILNWLKKFGIKIRTNSEAKKIDYKKGKVKIGLKGQEAWNKGLKGYMIGKNHYLWKGNKASYRSIHNKLRRQYNPPKKCEFCNKEKKIELSFDHSLGKETRDINDYKWLCHSCHIKRDWSLGVLNNQYTIKKGVKNSSIL